MNTPREQLLDCLTETDVAQLNESTRARDINQAARHAADAVMQSYEDWHVPKAESNLIDIFAPSLHRRAEFRTERHHAHTAVVTKPSQHGKWLIEILHLSLFVDRIWIPDPAEIVARAVDDIVRPTITVHHFLSDLLEAYNALKVLAKLEPLVEAGIVRYYPPLQLYESRIGRRLFGEYRDFSPCELANAWPDLFVEEGLLYADALKASYAALAREEFAALGSAAQDLRQNAGLSDARLVAALPELKLPYFEKISPELLVSVRRNEQAFEDFRNLLREAARGLPGGADSPQFSKEVSRVEEQVLSPAIKKLLGELKGTAQVGERLSEAGIDFAIGALAGFTLTGEPTAALPAGAVNALSQMLVKLLVKRPHIRPAGKIVYAFYSGRMPRVGILPSFRR